MMQMRVQAVADEDMPGDYQWVVAEVGNEVVLVVRASTTTRSPQSERLLNQALRRTG